ncbi:MAG: glycosyltransferase family 2 protein [Rhodospirillaceae bacterium]
MTAKPLLSIVTPCYNEEANIDELYRRISEVIQGFSNRYEFEIIVIDNNSQDETPDKLRALAAADPRVKVIFNVRNFGHIRSPYYGILQSTGVATIYLASDLQDPPELIPEFIRHWEQGAKLALAVKPVSEGSPLVHTLRKMYYRMLDKIAEVDILHDSTGFGLYDKEVLDHLRDIEDPYPFLRGLISELGYDVVKIPFVQPRRLRGISKNNIYTLYDIAWLGIISHSKVPIRMAAFCGFVVGGLSALAALVFLIMKLFFWSSFPIGISPLVIGLFGLFSIQFIFIGILGEYISAILTYVQRRPVVVERERINF